MTDNERETMLKKEYPELEFERYKVDLISGENCLLNQSEWWDLYDVPYLAMEFIDVLCNSPNKPTDLERWKSEHYVGRATNTRWRIVRKKE